ncbi:small subunit processome complex component [Purpureocillium lilacinum]|nr:small subunit processome complex component [Purpureocillium lilacinum]
MASGPASASEGVDWKDSRPLHAPQAPPHVGIDPTTAVDTAERRLQIRRYLHYHGHADSHDEIWKSAENTACLNFRKGGKSSQACTTMFFEYMVDYIVWNTRFKRYGNDVRPKWPFAEVRRLLASDKTPSAVYRAFLEAQETTAAPSGAPAAASQDSTIPQGPERKTSAVGSGGAQEKATTTTTSHADKWRKCLEQGREFLAGTSQSVAGSDSPAQAPSSASAPAPAPEGKGKEVARVPVAIPPGLSQSVYAPAAAKAQAKAQAKVEAEGKKPAEAVKPAEPQPSSAAAALAEREAWEKSEEGAQALEDARLLKGTLPEEPEPLNLSVREQIWAEQFRGLDWRQVGKPVCGPFELEFPAWLDLEHFFLGTMGADLRRVMKEHLDALLCLSWASAPELRGSKDAAMPVKIVLGALPEALDGLSRGEDGEPLWSEHPARVQLGKACVAFWYKLLDWDKRSRRNEPLPLISFLDLGDLREMWKHLAIGGPGSEKPVDESAAASAAWSVALDKARAEVVEILRREEDFGAATASMTAWVRRQASGPFQGPRAVAFAADNWVGLVTGEQQREVLRWRRELMASLEKEPQAPRPAPAAPVAPAAPQGAGGDGASWAQLTHAASRGSSRAVNISVDRAAATRGSSRGADRGASRGANRGADRGADRGASRGTSRGANRGADRGVSRGAHRGASRGTSRGADRGASRGTGRGA